MTMPKSLRTSESVTEGHPDKVADRISDAVLDAVLSGDRHAHVACETFLTTGLVLVGGEITTKTYVDIPTLVRRVVSDIGYDRPGHGFHFQDCAVLSAIKEQSADIDDAAANPACESTTGSEPWRLINSLLLHNPSPWDKWESNIIIFHIAA